MSMDGRGFCRSSGAQSLGSIVVAQSGPQKEWSNTPGTGMGAPGHSDRQGGPMEGSGSGTVV